MKNSVKNKELADRLFAASEAGFNGLALEVFRFQYGHNEIYRRFCDALKKDITQITHYRQVPFLPISFFKTHTITTGFEPGFYFESSGTTGSINSRHYVNDLELYKKSFRLGFEKFYGDPSAYCIIGLLPSYLERQHSSLVLMVDDLVQQSNRERSGFYLYDHEKLHATLLQNESEGIPTLLIGVTYALLDFAEAFPMQLQHTTVMETGGMKGRRREMTREEVHALLKERLGVAAVHSEYGMTELLSQAYSNGEGIFNCPPWMKILLREEDDPLTLPGFTNDQPLKGIINVIDLANLYSCSFIATDDIGKLYPGGSFEVLGRMDNSDVRGCGLMVG